ncbi:hypothetical protein SteCoe_24498 [Stentor coeruleus]|uniref:Uncharacterized protein n=1 Tax=Stentor coeruleus TaxID=5963 RepID=A0A1R2BHG0_9CILI|nr:hypothetical protein SteCoe_24498 [Stentor coeruleus]
MEQLHLAFLRFFVEFITSHSTNGKANNKLVDAMMKMKPVQKIIIKCMCKLEPIINDQIISLNYPRSAKSSTLIAKQSKLLIISQDVKNMMKNYDNIQGKISNMLNIVESIDFNIDNIVPVKGQLSDEPNELVTFLSSIVHKKRITNDEIEEISEDTWSKHLEVEKMLKVEIEKYYNQINAIELKYFNRLNHYKIKTGIKIERLEYQNKQTWENFRLLLDRTQMLYEDKISKEYEIYINEQDIINNNDSQDLYIKDYSSAIQKIKSLFTVRKILEKRKGQDDKLVTGLHNKINVLNEKINEIKDMNIKLLDNAASLSWSFEFLIGKFDIPAAVKEKSLKLISKQKCQKLEALFKIDGIFEKYSVDTVSQKFDELKEGIATVSNKIKDENVKIRLSKLIIESRLDEIDKTDVMKSITPIRSNILTPPISSSTPTQKTRKNIVGRSKSRKETLPTKEIKKENALERMRNAMYSIDEEIKQADKLFEESFSESSHIGNQSIYDFSLKDEDKRRLNSKNRLSRNTPYIGLSPKNSDINRFEVFSLQGDEIHKEDKDTQTIIIPSFNQEIQVDLELYIKIHEILCENKKNTENYDNVNIEEIDNFIYKATEFILREKHDKNIQTEKESGVLDFATPNNSIIRGLMNKVKTKKSDKKIVKLKLENKVPENFILKKNEISDISIFNTEPNKTQLSDFTLQENDKIIQNDFEDPELKQFNNTLPIPDTLLENKIIKLQDILTPSAPSEKNFKPSLQRKSELKIDQLKLASESYNKEFSLQAQIKGYKKLGFNEVQNLWEEVINRRILEGEKDKISVYLRGYLGTDKFESEKSRIISLLETSKSNKKDLDQLLNPKKKISKRIIDKWQYIMGKLLEKSSLNFVNQINPIDSPREIMYKAVKSIKYVKHRITLPSDKQLHRGRKNQKTENLIIYTSDKWSIHSTSMSPIDSVKPSSKNKLPKKLGFKVKSSNSKTPNKDKPSIQTKLPYI